MNIYLVLLIIISICSCATSQGNFNISSYDNQLRDIFNGLIETEKKIGNFLSNLNDFIDGIAKSNKSRFSQDLSHLQLILQLQGSIKNFESYQQLTGCGNVASKISEIDVDMKKFGDFVDRLELNMTELYHRNLHVTYDFVLFRKLQTSQQEILDLILGVNDAIVQYLFYILQLQTNIQYEKSIAANLGYFMTSSCKCSDNSTFISQMTKGLPSLSEMEAGLTDRQARIATAANKTLIESQKLAESKNVTGSLKKLTSRLSILSRKIRRINDYSNVTVPVADSCSSLSKVQNIYNYRRFLYTQVLSCISTNSSILKFYRESVMNVSNDYLALNASIKALSTSLKSLINELSNYALELNSHLVYSTFSNIYTQYQITIKTSCGCTADVADTTVNSMTTVGSLTSTFGKLTTTTSSFVGTTTTTRKLEVSSTTSASMIQSSTLSTTLGSTTSKSSTTTSIPSESTQQPTSKKSSSFSETLTTLAGKTTPKITTVPPYSNPACSFTKPLTDMTGTYIKTACLMETASNGTYGSSLCQDNSIKLMTIDSNMTQTAVTIFVQETLSEGNFWISGGNGSDLCNFVAVNGSGSAINQTWCSYANYYSICEYNDSKVPSKVNFSPNLDACGIIFPVTNEGSKVYTRYACVMAYTRSYTDSNYNCMLNGMKMFNIAPKSVLEVMDEFLVSYFGNNSGIIMWINSTTKAGSCAYLDGNKVPFEVGSGSCDQLSWSICETSYDGSY